MVYRTMQGRVIDLEKLMRQNELTPAVGNMKVNARGDEIGTNGKILKKREDIVAEYYADNPNAKPRRTQPTAKQTQPKIEEVVKETISKSTKNSNRGINES